MTESKKQKDESNQPDLWALASIDNTESAVIQAYLQHALLYVSAVHFAYIKTTKALEEAPISFFLRVCTLSLDGWWMAQPKRKFN